MAQQVQVGGRQHEAQRHTFYYGWLVVGASFLMTLLSMGTQGSFGNFLKPMSAEFGWDRATAALPISVALLMNGLFQPLVGYLVDRVGPRRVITLSILLMAVSTAAIALTPNIWYLTAVYGMPFALGLSGAGSIPNIALAARWFVQRRGQAMGIVSAGGSIGQLLLIPASMALLLWTDWRMTYLILSGLLLLVGTPIAFLVLRNTPQDLGLLPDGEQARPDDRAEAGGQAPVPQPAPLEPAHWLGAFTTAPLWLLSGGFFVCGFSLSLVSTHFVALATDRGIAPGTAATALGLLSGCNIVGSLLAGPVSDRVGRKNPLALLYFVRALAFLLLLSADSAWQLYLFAVLAGLAWFSTVPLTVSLTAEIYGVRHMGILIGLAFTSHQLGGALSSYLAGWFFDLHGSYTLMYLVSIGLLLGASIASYAIQERRYSLKYVTLRAAA